MLFLYLNIPFCYRQINLCIIKEEIFKTISNTYLELPDLYRCKVGLVLATLRNAKFLTCMH